MNIMMRLGDFIRDILKLLRYRILRLKTCDGKIRNCYQHLKTPVLPTNPNLCDVAMSNSKDHPPVRKKHLLVDLSELVKSDIGTGIQRVARSIFQELLKNPPEGYEVLPVYLKSPTDEFMYGYKYLAKIQKIKPLFRDSVVDALSGDIFLGLDLNHSASYKVNFFEIMRARGCLVYFVVYDVLPLTLSVDYFNSRVREAHHRWVNLLSSQNGVLCISRTVADEFSKTLTVYSPKRKSLLKIGWFHLGADISAFPSKGVPKNAEAILSKLQMRQTFLMVGTIEPRKRHLDVLSAFDTLWQQGVDVNLVIVGGLGGWNVDLIVKLINAHQENEKRLFWLKGPSDEYLDKIYLASDCLIAASIGEGFGLPIIEAAKHGISIIARDIPVFREVAGKSALYFSNNVENDLVKCIQHWLAHEKHQNAATIACLTWAQSTQQLVNVMINNDWYSEWVPNKELRLLEQ